MGMKERPDNRAVKYSPLGAKKLGIQEQTKKRTVKYSLLVTDEFGLCAAAVGCKGERRRMKLG